jgi:hypothetical protein
MDFEISKERRMSETTDLKTFPAPEPLATPTDFAEEQAKEIFTFPDTLGQLVRRVGGTTIRGAPVTVPASVAGAGSSVGSQYSARHDVITGGTLELPVGVAAALPACRRGSIVVALLVDLLYESVIDFCYILANRYGLPFTSTSGGRGLAISGCPM